MKLADFSLFTDENLKPEFVEYLRENGFDVADVKERGISGESDESLLELALQEERVIVTHDGDFGRLAVGNSVPVVGIVYLRPGHIDPTVTIEIFETVLAADLDVRSPFLIVAKKTDDEIAIRVRQW